MIGAYHKWQVRYPKEIAATKNDLAKGVSTQYLPKQHATKLQTPWHDMETVHPHCGEKPPTCDEDLNPSSNSSKSADLKTRRGWFRCRIPNTKGIKGENNLESENGISFQMTREKIKHRPPKKKAAD